MKLEAVLFDLDGTLLDIDLEAFLSTYFERLGPVVAAVTGGSVESGISAVLDATQQMMRSHPGLTNADVFWERFSQSTGVRLGASEAKLFEAFYADEFPRLRAGHVPRDGAHEAVRAAHDLGMTIAVATNPIFPLAAIRERLRWAGLNEAPFKVITSYECMTACKPLPAYFEQTAHMLGVDVHTCLMVGDDRSLDMAAADIGMKTFYCGPDQDVSADYVGDLSALAALLPRLT